MTLRDESMNISPQWGFARLDSPRGYPYGNRGDHSLAPLPLACGTALAIFFDGAEVLLTVTLVAVLFFFAAAAFSCAAFFLLKSRTIFATYALVS